MKFKNLILVLILAPVSIFAKTKDTPCYFVPFEFTEETVGTKGGTYEFGFTSNNVKDEAIYSKENDLNKKRADFFLKYEYNKRVHKVSLSKNDKGEYELAFNIVHYFKNKKTGEEKVVGLIEEKYIVSRSVGYNDLESKFQGYNLELSRLGGLISSEYVLFTDNRVTYDDKGEIDKDKTILTEVGVITRDSYLMCGINIVFKPALYGVITSLTYTKKKY